MKAIRRRLTAMWELNRSVPFPKNGSGRETATIHGYVTYQADMREFQQGMNALYQALLMEGREGLVEGDDYYNPDSIIQALREWVQYRAEHQWDDDIPAFQTFMKRVLEREQV